MTAIFKDFREGFVGAFVLAAAIVMAIVSVASAFANGGIDGVRHRGDDHART